jgi:uncharacterized membrane protein
MQVNSVVLSITWIIQISILSMLASKGHLKSVASKGHVSNQQFSVLSILSIKVD